MNWLIHQLFGANATTNLKVHIKAEIAAYIAQNGSTVGKAAVVAAITRQADTIIPKVLLFFPKWSQPFITPLLEAAVPGIISSAYDEVIKVI